MATKAERLEEFSRTVEQMKSNPQHPLYKGGAAVPVNQDESYIQPQAPTQPAVPERTVSTYNPFPAQVQYVQDPSQAEEIERMRSELDKQKNFNSQLMAKLEEAERLERDINAQRALSLDDVELRSTDADDLRIVLPRVVAAVSSSFEPKLKELEKESSELKKALSKRTEEFNEAIMRQRHEAINRTIKESFPELESIQKTKEYIDAVNEVSEFGELKGAALHRAYMNGDVQVVKNFLENVKKRIPTADSVAHVSSSSPSSTTARPDMRTMDFDEWGERATELQNLLKRRKISRQDYIDGMKELDTLKREKNILKGSMV